MDPESWIQDPGSEILDPGVKQFIKLCVQFNLLIFLFNLLGVVLGKNIGFSNWGLCMGPRVPGPGSQVPNRPALLSQLSSVEFDVHI